MKRVTVLAVLTTAMLLGCAPKQEQPREPLIPPPTTYSIPTPTATEPYAPVKSLERQAAEKAVTEYFRLKNQVLTDHSADLEPLAALLTGPLLEYQIPFVEEDRAENIIQKGEFSYVVHNSVVVSPGNIEVLACTDVTGTDVVDLDTGESVLDANRSMHRNWRIDVQQVNDTWKLANYTTDVVASCEP
ncbi:MAG: hypothetical protein Q4D96_08215 [Propionibacteriaceae bacterium]|nr:hypothetical protein [Propionibacteriaceae bacterium]